MVRGVHSSFTCASIIDDETVNTLRSALLANTSILRNSSCFIRIDAATGFQALRNDLQLKQFDIELDFGYFGILIQTTMILLNKLEHYGIRGNVLKWFQSYLSNCKYYVSINGQSSELLGVLLGPLLSLIYINDLPNIIDVLKFYCLQMILTFIMSLNIYLNWKKPLA